MRAVSIGKIKINIHSLGEYLIGLILLVPLLGIEWPTAFFGARWSFYRLAACLILLVVLVVSLRRMGIVYLLYGSVFSVITISTFLNDKPIMPALNFACGMICFVALIDYFSKRKKLLHFLTITKNIIGAVILLTLFFQIYSQDIFGFTASSNHINFLASDNFLGYYYVPFIMLVYITEMNSQKRDRLIQLVFWSVICFISLVFAWAATCLAVYVIFLFVLYFNKTRIVSILTPFNAMLFNISIIALVLVFHIQNYFEWLIVDILHKDITISGRVYIWKAAIADILKRPILGYGTVQGGRVSMHKVPEFGVTFFSHNLFLELMVQGGIVALLLYMLLYFFAGKRLRSAVGSDRYHLNTILSLTIFSILLMQFSEFDAYLPFANLPLILCFFYRSLHAEMTEESPVVSPNAE